MGHNYVYERLIETDVFLVPKLSRNYRGAIVTTFHKYSYNKRGEEISGYSSIRRDWSFFGVAIDDKLDCQYLSDVTCRMSPKWDITDLSLGDYILGSGSHPEYMGDVSSIPKTCMAVATYFNDDDTITNECMK